MVPVVFFCQNNQWAISEPVRLQSHASIAQRGQGYGIPGIQVDGNDVLAVLAATRLALARAYAGQGPTLIEAVTYRMGPHTTSDDPTRYRSRAEEEEWRVKDPLARLRPAARRGPGRRRLRQRVDAGGRAAAAALRRGCLAMADPEPADAVRPRLRGAAPAARGGAGGLRGLPGRVRRGARDGHHVAGQGAQQRAPPGHGARPQGRPDGGGHREARRRVPGHRGLQRDFGDRRVIDTPLAESGVIGTAVGLAMRGYRPVCEIQFDGFIYPAFDQIVSQVAKLHYRNEGRVAMPLTIRVPYGGGIGAVEHHSESPEAYFAHTAGLRVVTPSNAADGYRMIQQAIASDDPVVFFEPKRRYWEKGEVDDEGAARRCPAAAAPRSSSGRAATSPSSPTAPWWPRRSTRRGSPRRRARPSRSIDLRSLSPVDFETIEVSVRKTGRLVVAHEASVFCGLGAEIAARISERCFYHLESPVRRVGGFATPYPASRAERHFLPDADRILHEVDRCLQAVNPSGSSSCPTWVRG